MTQPNEQIDRLEEIKSYDDSYWLHYLRINTIFDADNIKFQKDWLISALQQTKEELECLKEACNGYEMSASDAIAERNDVQAQLEQVKAERDFYKNVRDPHEKLLSLHTELAAKDKVLHLIPTIIDSPDYDHEEKVEILKSNIDFINRSYPPREKGDSDGN